MGPARHAIHAAVLFVSFVALAWGDESLPADALQRLKGATVYVKTEIGPLPLAGSGFVIDVTGDTALIATNHHVVTTPKELQAGTFIPGLRGRDRMAIRRIQQALAGKEPAVSIVLNSGEANEQSLKAEIVGALDDPDLAILKVSGVKNPPRPIEFRTAQQPTETLPLYILGFPFGDALATNKGNPNITVGKGSVSSVRKDAAGRIVKVQIDGALNPGNSGGPVVDSKGNLIGISVQTIQGSNIGLAIPAAELASVLDGRVGTPTVVVAAGVNGGAATCEIVVPVIDPMKKLKSAAVQYVKGAVTADAALAGRAQLQSAAGSKAVNLAINGQTGRAALAVTPSGDKPMDITAQVSYVNAQGQTVYLDPQVLKVAAPAVITSKTEGNTTTITKTQKNSKGGTVRRQITITRGDGKSKFDDVDDDADKESSDAGEEKPAAKSKKGKTKKAAKSSDDEDSSDADEEKPATKSTKSKKKVVESSDDEESEGRAEASWTKSIAKMKKIPKGEVAGKLDGIEFEPDKVEITAGRLVFSKGKRQVFSELQLDVVLFTGPNDDVSGKKLIVNGKLRAGDPHINMSVMRKGDKLPRMQPHLEYLLVLEFGDYDAELRVQPGKIYICLPDRAKSYLAGSFEAAVD